MKELSVNIQEPCHEDWSAMSPVEQGRHCQSCQKTVVDFTKMSKSGVADYLQSNSGNLCGRFSADQLNVNLLPPKKNKWYAKYAAMLIGVLPLAGMAQQVPDQTEQPITMGKRVMQVNQTTPKAPINIKGQIVDAGTGGEIMFATVALYDQHGELITSKDSDLEGRFEITISKGQHLELSYIGGGTSRYSYQDIQQMGRSHVFKMTEVVLKDADFILGEVEYVDTDNAKSEVIQNVDLETVEIVGYRVPVVKGGFTTTTCTTTGMMAVVVAEEKESWLDRMWKKLKRIAKRSYTEAQKIREADKMIEEVDPVEVEDVVLTSGAKGIESIDRPFLTIYPNPSAGFVMVRLPESHTEGILQVVDASNQLVYAEDVSGVEVQVDFSALSSGTYVVSMVADQSLIASQIFIKM